MDITMIKNVKREQEYVMLDSNDKEEECSDNNNNDNNNNREEEYNVGSKQEVHGAAALGAIVGIFLGGPIIAALAAAIAAYLAAVKEGSVGDFCRKGGKAANDLGKSIVKAEKKHHWLDKTTKGLVKGANWVETKCRGSKEERKEVERETEVKLTL
jgi:hypothetical protein